MSPPGTLVARFRARLEAELQRAERVLTTHAEKYGRVPLAGTFGPGFEVVTSPSPRLVRHEHLTHAEAIQEYGAADEPPAPSSIPLVTFLMEAWPETLPNPVPVEAALQVVREEADAIARATAAEVEELAGIFVPEGVRTAVLDRERLTDMWAWPTWAVPIRVGLCLDGMVTGVEVAEAPPMPWPGHDKPRRQTSVGKYSWHPRMDVPDTVAFRDVFTWAKEPLSRLSLEGPEALEAVLADNSFPVRLPYEPHTRAFTLRAATNDAPALMASPWALGLLLEAVRDVEAHRRRPGIALDASNAHRSLVESVVAMPKDTRQPWEVASSGGYYELVVPGAAEQYALTLPGVHMSERMTEAIRTLRGPEGLRHWLAFQVGFTGRGRRSGVMRWTVEEHLDALQVPRKHRPGKVDTALSMAELFLHLELVRRSSPRSRVVERGPVFHVRNWYGRENAGHLRLDGVDFGINPWLYGGVRQDDGELGENFAWAPAELAAIDHVRHPYSVSLGPVLAIRMRIHYANHGEDTLRMSGESLLRAAGAAKGYKARDPGRTWRAIHRDLDELVERGALGGYGWEEGGPSLRAIIRLSMPTLMRDRMLHEVRPLELGAPPPSTGAELQAWRKARGLTQAALARLVGMTGQTVSNAERRGEERLPPRLREALRRVLEAPPPVLTAGRD